MATLKERRELIESLKIPGRRTATLRQDADAWLRNWRSERGINPNSGVIPNDPAEAPAHLRLTIFGRRAQALPQRSGMQITHHMFTEPTRDQLLQEVISNPELDKSDFERILGPDYETEIEEWKNKQQPKQNLKINPPEALAMADKMYRVTELDKKQNNEAWKQLMKGNPNYFYKPIKEERV